MVARLKKDGDQYTLVIDPTLVEGLVGPGGEVSLTRTGKSLVITPLDDEQRRAKFDQAKRDTFERYDDVFRRLAE